MAGEPTPREAAIRPMFFPRTHQRTQEALSILLMHLELDEAVSDALVAPLLSCVEEMADSLFPDVEGVLDLSDSVTVREIQYAHPVKVAELSMLILRLVGAQRGNLRHLGLAALLMNVGNTRTRPTLLDHAGPLDAAGWAEIREHVVRGDALLEGSGVHEDVRRAVAEHHERFDGSGYPNGVAAREISVYGRVLGIADTYVAMCSRRAHRPACTEAVAREYLETQAGVLFDPALVRVALSGLAQFSGHGRQAA